MNTESEEETSTEIMNMIFLSPETILNNILYKKNYFQQVYKWLREHCEIFFQCHLYFISGKKLIWILFLKWEFSWW